MRKGMYRGGHLTGVVAGLVLMVGVTSGWGGPPNNDVSDAQGNTAGGTNALLHTTGSYNTAFGNNALYSSTIRFGNTASGMNALLSNTTGFGNTVSGNNALYSNTTGYYNTASGVQALLSKQSP
jgi:hypothetical protein